MQQNALVRRALMRYQQGRGGADTVARLQAAGYSPGQRDQARTLMGAKRNILLGQALARAEQGPVSARTQARIDRGLQTTPGVRFTGQALGNSAVRQAALKYLRNRTGAFQQSPDKSFKGLYRQGF